MLLEAFIIFAREEHICARDTKYVGHCPVYMVHIKTSDTLYIFVFISKLKKSYLTLGR